MTRIGGSATTNRTLEFDYDLSGNLESKTSDVSADDDTTGYDYHPGTNRLKEAAIGDVKYEFPPDSSGHIEQYACTDDDMDEVDDCADVEDTFIEWNARGLAEKMRRPAPTASPTNRDPTRLAHDDASAATCRGTRTRRATTTNRLSGQRIGDVDYRFAPDSSRHITQ